MTSNSAEGAAPSLTAIIPAFNSARYLHSCLTALTASRDAPSEILVVDDCSTDDTRAVAARFPVTVLHTERTSGPAYARNLGAAAAHGELLFFLDSDVCVHPTTTEQIRSSFQSDPALDALIGSYDHNPQSPDFLSQYRNLMHCFVHQTGSERASTFWSGCGAIRRSVFLEHSGFDEGFGRPAIEDIELGYRLNRAGCRIVLDREVQVTHLKRWTFWGLVKTDILDRGIPWTELILRDGFMPNDLNLQLSQRVSVALVFLLVGFSGFMVIKWRGYFLVPLIAVLIALLARWWVEFTAPERPKWALAMLAAVLLATMLLAARHGMTGLIPPLLLTPALLLTPHRYSAYGVRRVFHQALTLVCVGGTVFAAVSYLPARGPLFFTFILLATLGLMNSQFYLFLAGKRGIPFMLAAVPFHLLYHLYNGLSFLAGSARHLWERKNAEIGKTASKPRLG